MRWKRHRLARRGSSKRPRWFFGIGAWIDRPAGRVMGGSMGATTKAIDSDKKSWPQRVIDDGGTVRPENAAAGTLSLGWQ